MLNCRKTFLIKQHFLLAGFKCMARVQSLIAISSSKCKDIECQNFSKKYGYKCMKNTSESIGYLCDVDINPGLNCDKPLNSKNQFNQCYRK